MGGQKLYKLECPKENHKNVTVRGLNCSSPTPSIKNLSHSGDNKSRVWAMGSYRREDTKRNRVTGTKTEKIEADSTQEMNMNQTTSSASSSGAAREVCLQFKYCHQLRAYLVFSECLLSLLENADREQSSEDDGKMSMGTKVTEV